MPHDADRYSLVVTNSPDRSLHVLGNGGEEDFQIWQSCPIKHLVLRQSELPVTRRSVHTSSSNPICHRHLLCATYTHPSIIMDLNSKFANLTKKKSTALEAVPAPPAPLSTSVFKADLFKGKVLFCTGGGSGICKTMTEAVVSSLGNGSCRSFANGFRSDEARRLSYDRWPQVRPRTDRSFAKALTV